MGTVHVAAMDVLVIDIGGSHVKLRASRMAKARRFKSGPEFTPAKLVALVREAVQGWPYDAVSIGYPGTVDENGPTAEPGNLAPGWVGFDFEDAFGRPVRVVNDAVMQALGVYAGGRMLFLGLGTGLGSALVTEHVIVPMELGSLPYGDGGTIAEHVGREGLKARGERRWLKEVVRVTEMLRVAFVADYVVLGGGNAKRVTPLPPKTRRGDNAHAIVGGFRLWEDTIEPHDRPPAAGWRVVR
jgi:polyphosphate glucokinase